MMSSDPHRRSTVSTTPRERAEDARQIDANGLHPGDRVGPYEVIGELGRGGMGIVFKVRDARLGRFAALKILPPYLALNAIAEDRFIAEMRAASVLDHPNICTIYDAGEHEGCLYFTMALYDGNTVESLVKEGPLAIEVAVDLTMQAASGLAEAHRLGVIHRDIKPANLIVGGSGILKILDFGVAKVGSGANTAPSTLIGTTAYMSPEQLRGEVVDPRADLWALGVVLYEMLAGSRPFNGNHEAAVMYAVSYQDPTPLRKLRPDVPSDLERIVRKALQRDREQRYQHAMELLDDLQQAGELSESAQSGIGRDGTLRHASAPRAALAPEIENNSVPGTLTFFFSDVEGSTRLIHRIGGRYAEVIVGLRQILRAAVRRHGGREVDTAGDGYFAVFSRARDAVAASADVQRSVHRREWPEGADVLVRIGLHTGEPELADGSYMGVDVHRAARICSAAGGGQVLLSRLTADLVRRDIGGDIRLLDVGTHSLKDLPVPEHLFQLEIAGAPAASAKFASRPGRVDNLPVQLTSFVGRRREVERVKELLRSARLVTLTGPGGTGKTRLSLEVAAELADEYENVVFVGLAPLSDPALILDDRREDGLRRLPEDAIRDVVVVE